MPFCPYCGEQIGHNLHFCADKKPGQWYGLTVDLLRIGEMVQALREKWWKWRNKK